MPVISPPSAVEDAVALTKSADDDFAQMQPATSAPTLQSDLCPTDTDIHVAEETQAHPLPSDAPSAQDTPSWPVNDTQPAKKIAFYAWNATLEPQITPALFLVQSESTAVVLAKAKTAWSRLDPRHRCIIIAPWSKYQGPPFNAPLRDLVIDGPNLSDTRRWWSNVLWTLKKNDLAPYRVALDWETGMTYWHIKGTGNPDQRAQFQAVWEDAEAFAKLPDELRKINPDQINWQVSREAVITWNHYATQQRTQALRQAYAEPLHETFPNVRITNYGDMHFAGSLRDANGWPLRNSGLTDESSPVIYRENAADNLALIRGVVDVGGKPPVPWVSHPSYIGRDVWEATIRGAYDLGVREFLYWNPDIDSKAADDDQFAASVIADLSRIQEAHAFAAFD